MHGYGKFTVWLQKEDYLLHSRSLSLSSDSLCLCLSLLLDDLKWLLPVMAS